MRTAADYALVRDVLDDLGGEVYRTRLALGASEHDVMRATGLTARQLRRVELRNAFDATTQRVLLAWLVSATREHEARRERLRREVPFSDRSTEENR